MNVIKPLVVLLMLSVPVTGCGRKGPLKPPPDARAIPQTLPQDDESSPSNQPVASEPVTSE